MPFSTPETAESTKHAVSTAMIPIRTRVADLADAADDLQPALDLQRAEAERGGRAEEGGEDRQHVDDLAGRPLGATLADERDEHRGDQLAPALAVGAVRDREPDDGVDGPRVERPVEQRLGHRGLGQLGLGEAAAVGYGEAGVVGEERERLVDAVEHQADAHAGGEHHGDPRRRSGTRARRCHGRAGCCRTCSPPARSRRPRSRRRPARRTSRARSSSTPAPCRRREASEAVLTKPHTRKATAIAAVTPKTTLSIGEVLGRLVAELVVQRRVSALARGPGPLRRLGLVGLWIDSRSHEMAPF